MTAVELTIDDALGPGLDVAEDAGVARLVAARPGGLWLGLDRAHLVDSDAGDGTELPAVVAVPTSTFVGCRIAAELDGALVADGRTVLVARLSGHARPAEAVIRTVARLPGGRWVDAAAADRIAREARQRFRVRRQAGRVLGGRAWRASSTDPGERRFTTPHSRSEYRLERLPPRFIRGLEGLLDIDERILYSIERPPDAISGGRFGLARRGAERRAGLLLLTDRQLIWMVDHLPPDRYLFDWGVDARLVALEALRGVRLSGHATAELHVQTRGGGAIFALPVELRPEAEVMRDLLLRFLPVEDSRAAVRRYAPVPVEFDHGPAALFGQSDEALREVQAIRERVAPEELLGAFYAPRRESVRHAVTIGLTRTRLALLAETQVRSVGLDLLRDIAITLSPLIGRVELTQPASAASHDRISVSYPATMSGSATAFLRLLRKAWADSASAGSPAADSSRDASPRVEPRLAHPESAKT